MKKLLLVAVSISTLSLAGCNCNINVANNCDTSSETKQFCLEKGWTYSRVTSPDEEYWECMFPSGVGCRDDYVQSGECEFEADTSSIDTEEKRLTECKKNVQWRMEEMVDWAENISTEWENEIEGWDMITRNWVISYTKDWNNWKMKVECEANFVDWSLWVSYSDEEIVE